MRSIDRWLGLYAESHRNPTNKQIHWLCVPVIVWSVVALLYAIPAPITGLWAWIAGLLAFGYYLALSPRLAVGLSLGMILFAALAHFGVQRLGQSGLAILAGVLFVAAWIGQFIGHEIEGKKPSFFTDLAFLLIGPAWLMAFVYRRLRLSY